MMKTYARIESGRVAEIIVPMEYEIDAPEGAEPTFAKGEEVPVERRFPADFVASLVDIGSQQVNVGDNFKNGVFSPYVAPGPTAAEILTANTSTRDALLAVATARIAPFQDAVDLGDASVAETAALKAWKQYRVAVNRVDLSLATPSWPAVPA